MYFNLIYESLNKFTYILDLASCVYDEYLYKHIESMWVWVEVSECAVYSEYTANCKASCLIKPRQLLKQLLRILFIHTHTYVILDCIYSHIRRDGVDVRMNTAPALNTYFKAAYIYKRLLTLRTDKYLK